MSATQTHAWTRALGAVPLEKVLRARGGPVELVANFEARTVEPRR